MSDNTNIKLENLSSKIINESGINSSTEYTSVLLTIMIIGIILNCIRVIQECSNNKTRKMSKEETVVFYQKEIRKLSDRKGWYTKMRIRKAIRREMKMGVYKEYGSSIVDSMLSIGENITEDEVSSILEALNV